ncbi:MAG: hypothetical protein JST12_05270 [Armatimonadetes bacterium]|nr:hypothetical protein [Armatimonadota bacterium]
MQFAGGWRSPNSGPSTIGASLFFWPTVGYAIFYSIMSKKYQSDDY